MTPTLTGVVLASLFGLTALLAGALAPVTFTVRYLYADGRQEFSVESRAFWGLLVFRHEIPAFRLGFRGLVPRLETRVEMEAGSLDAAPGGSIPAVEDARMLYDLEAVRGGWELLRHFYATEEHWLGYLGRRMAVTRFQWHSDLGHRDAAVTGWAVGAMWALKSGALAWFQSKVPFTVSPDLFIGPSFDRPRFRSAIICIFALRVVHIIVAGLIFWRESRGKGVGLPWRNIPSRA